MKDLYKEIFKRKSFHTFREKSNELINEEEIKDIYDFYHKCDVLFPDIKTDIKIVKTKETTCTRAAEYCIEFFSEKKDGYLQNIGYIGEQIDLYLVSKNIGTLWFGIAKLKEVYNGLDYVIMMAINKVDEANFRKDMFKAKRKEIDKVSKDVDENIVNIVRFAPSACNSQPWFIEKKDNEILLYRVSKSGRVGIMPKNAACYFNQIDIGIFMCFLELVFNNLNIKYNRTLYKDNGGYDSKELNASYSI